jgi:hypothetical protein
MVSCELVSSEECVVTLDGEMGEMSVDMCKMLSPNSE